MLLQCYQNRSILQHFLSRNWPISIGLRLSKSTDFADLGHSLVKEILQQFQKSIARTPDCCDNVVTWYSIAILLRENRLECHFGNLTDSQQVESKSIYSENRHCKIEIFCKSCFEIVAKQPIILLRDRGFDCCDPRPKVRRCSPRTQSDSEQRETQA